MKIILFVSLFVAFSMAQTFISCGSGEIACGSTTTMNNVYLLSGAVKTGSHSGYKMGWKLKDVNTTSVGQIYAYWSSRGDDILCPGKVEHNDALYFFSIFSFF